MACVRFFDEFENAAGDDTRAPKMGAAKSDGGGGGLVGVFDSCHYFWHSIWINRCGHVPGVRVLRGHRRCIHIS